MMKRAVLFFCLGMLAIVAIAASVSTYDQVTANSVTATSFTNAGVGATKVVITDANGKEVAATLSGITLVGATLSASSSGVTSVGLVAPAEFSVSGSPVTTSGSITFSKANQNANLVYAGPSSGAATAPTFRALASGDLTGLVLKHPKIRKTALFSASGSSVPAAWGDAVIHEGTAAAMVAPTATEGVTRESSSAASTLSPIGDHGNNNWRVGRNLYFGESCKLTNSASGRFWLGLTDATTVQNQASEPTASGNFAAFRYSTSLGDTKWQCVCQDGSGTSTTVNSNITPDTAIHLFEITEAAGASWTFSIDGSVVATITTHMPTSGTNLRYVDGGLTTSSTALALRWEWLMVEADR